MKIGIFDPYLDDLGGGEKYMGSIAECLSEKHHVDIFWDNADDIEKLVQRFSLNFAKVHIVKNIFTPAISLRTRIPQTKKYDAIIYLSDGSIPFTFTKKLFLHIQQPLAQFNKQTIKDKLKLSMVTGIFCNSLYTKSFNEQRFKINTTVIYPPVHLAPKNLQKENIILTVGRYRVKDPVTGTDDYKKLPVMIEAFKQMLDKGFTNWRFIIATSVHEKDQQTFRILERETAGFPIEFLVNLSNDALWDIYSRAKIYWHAAGYREDLKQHPERAEHFGISTVEAMGAGCVPIVINAGGQREIVTDGINGLLWDTLEDLREKTKTVASDPDLWEKLSENAKKRAQDFTPERFCEAVQRLIG